MATSNGTVVEARFHNRRIDMISCPTFARLLVLVVVVGSAVIAGSAIATETALDRYVAKPDAVYSPLWGDDFVTFVKQANRHDFFKKVGAFFTPAGLAMDAFYALGKEVPKGIYTCSHGYWFEHPDTPRNKKWVETFVSKWGVYPHVTAYYTYSAVYYLKAAVEKARTTDTEAVITALEGMEQQGAAYRTVIRKEDHQAITDVPWGVTREAKDLEPLFVRMADIRDSRGEEIVEPIAEILERRKTGAEPPWRKYVIKG